MVADDKITLCTNNSFMYINVYVSFLQYPSISCSGGKSPLKAPGEEKGGCTLLQLTDKFMKAGL